MGRLFCYTLSARAIGATVSAGALHAQGWGFESLIAHHLNDKASSNGGLSFWAHRRGIRTRQGAELRKRASVFQRSTQGAKRRSGSGRRQPHAISFIAHHLFDNGSRKGAVFVWAPRRGIRTRQGAELRKREAFSSAAREERSDEADAGGEAARGHPSSPTTELETVLERGPFLFGPIAEGFEPARMRS